MKISSRAIACACVMLVLALAGPAEAHVKWFAQWDIVCPPRDPRRVLSLDLWRAFFAAAVAAMAALAALDWHLARNDALDRFSRRVHDAVAPRAIPLLRCGLAIYFVLAATCLAEPAYLTPELRAPHWVAAVQLAAAALVLWRPTAWLAGLALIGLYAMAVAEYGWFHLLDYPLFLGLGVILLLPKLARGDSVLLSLDVLRASAAVTLLWGGIEKFAYPEWSFDLMKNISFLSLGVSPETAMYMYGFGEVALSFGLLAFGVGSQIAAALLLLVFVVAIPPFGMVDLVGHSGIIAGLVPLTLTRSRLRVRLRSAARNAAWHGAAFSATLVALGIGYFGLHELYIAPKTAARLLA
ncbi:hypothetical protein [Pseudoduganella namucuonensis]|uniref:DoxX family membrane protein n=1 Tax=Pseudoduganella namucuonensis TaxID=1035707 RepID=A0A1I7HW40_9BURK|nr:hypothetical protein [Pseudoduganella namucuonensis]SFU64829.1 hypothetical protein SAMN05216552_1006223 [Pseudoduganella namucuonensis]